MLDFVLNCVLWIKEHNVTSYAVFWCLFTCLHYSHYIAKTSSHFMELFFSIHFYMWFLSFRIFIVPILFFKVSSQKSKKLFRYFTNYEVCIFILSSSYTILAGGVYFVVYLTHYKSNCQIRLWLETILSHYN